MIEALVVIAVLSVSGMALMSMNVTTMKSIKSSGIRSELQDVKNAITSQLSCEKTLAPYGPGVPVNCSGNVVLRKKNNTPLIPASEKLGKWTVTARCESLGGSNGLSVYATMKGANGGYVKDPLNSSVIFDEKSAVSMLFKPNVRPCASFFTGDANIKYDSCPPNTYLKGISFESQKLNCEPIPTCNGNALIFNGTEFTCTSYVKTAELGNGPIKDIGGGSEKQCGDGNRMRCPAGFVQIGYRAWVTGSDITSCRVICRGLK